MDAAHLLLPMYSLLFYFCCMFFVPGLERRTVSQTWDPRFHFHASATVCMENGAAAAGRCSPGNLLAVVLLRRAKGVCRAFDSSDT